METSKPLLKDAEAEDVDVHLYRSMIGSLMYLTTSRPDIMFAVCACARFHVIPKGSHLHAVKRIFRYLKGQPKLGLWYPKDSPFDLEAYTDSDYAGASLDKKSTTRVKNLVFHSRTKHIEIRHHFIRDSNKKKLIQMIKIHTDHNVADLLTKAFDVGRFQYLITINDEIQVCAVRVTYYWGNDADMMFDIGVLEGDEVVVETKEPVSAAAIITSSIPISAVEVVTTVSATTIEETLAQTLIEIKVAKPKAVTTTATTVTTAAVTRPKAKGFSFMNKSKYLVSTKVFSTQLVEKTKAKEDVDLSLMKKHMKKKRSNCLDSRIGIHMI
ncbi:hypothetical protein Tco_1330430 [Tanacetum coccineum]